MTDFNILKVTNVINRCKTKHRLIVIIFVSVKYGVSDIFLSIFYLSKLSLVYDCLNDLIKSFFSHWLLTIIIFHFSCKLQCS